MKPGDELILKKDIIYKTNKWGSKGEKVEIISISGNAVILEGKKNKNRFPCNIKDLE